MATELETLLIRVEADTRRLRSNMERAEKQLQKSSGNMSKSMKAFDLSLQKSTAGIGKMKALLGVAIPAITLAALGKLIEKSVTAADSIAKIADKTGFTTDQLQELRYAADQASVSQQTLDLALQRFSRRIGEAAQGSGELYDTLKQYNIGILDSAGKTRANIDILGDLANAIKGAKSQQEALRIAFKAFDSEGAALVNLLRGGKTALDEMRAKAQALGLVMSADLVRQGEDARSKLDSLWFVLSAKLNIVMARLAPIIVRVAEALFRVAEAALQAFDNFAKFVGLVKLNPVESQVETLQRKNLQLEASIYDPYATARRMVSGRSIEDIKKEIEANKQLIRVLQDNKGVFDALGGGTTPRGGSTSGFRLPPKAGAGSKKSEFQNLTDNIQSRINAMRLEQEQIGKTTAEQEKLRLEHELSNFEIMKNVTLTDQQREQLKQLQELYNGHIDRLEQVRQKHEQLVQTNQLLGQSYDEVAGIITEGLFGAFENGVQSFKDAAKQMLQYLAKLIIQLGVVNVLKNSLFGGSAGFKPSPTLGSIFGSLFGGGKASGGPVSAGKTYMVGEKGPELFQPSMSGRIVPNNKMAGGGATYYVDATGASRAEFERFKAWVTARDGRVEERAVKAVLSRNARTLGAA